MAGAAFDDFRRLQHGTFRMQAPDGESFPIVLATCDGTAESFALTFRAGADAPESQSTYVLSAPGLPPQPVFLVPVRRHAGTEAPLEYAAVFAGIPGDAVDGGAR